MSTDTQAFNAINENYGMAPPSTSPDAGYINIGLIKSAELYIARVVASWQKVFLYNGEFLNPMKTIRNFGMLLITNGSQFMWSSVYSIYMASLQVMKQTSSIVMLYGAIIFLLNTVKASIFNVSYGLYQVYLVLLALVPVLIASVILAPLVPLVAGAATALFFVQWGLQATTVIPLIAIWGIKILIMMWTYFVQVVTASMYLWMPLLFVAVVPLFVLGGLMAVWAPFVPYLAYTLAVLVWIMSDRSYGCFPLSLFIHGASKGA